MLSVIEEIIRDLLIFVAVTFALFIVVLVVVSKMPDDNPLKRITDSLELPRRDDARGRSCRSPHRADPGA